MAHRKNTQLPNVLANYHDADGAGLNENKPKIVPKSDVRPINNVTSSGEVSPPSGGTGESPSEHRRSPRPSQSRRSPTASKPGKSERDSPKVKKPVRERTFEIQRRQELQRFEQNFDNWQQAKQETKEEDTRRLRSKLNLQQELIKAQEEQFQEQQLRKRQQQDKKRKDAQTDRRAKADALQQICRQSLEDDREAKRENQRAKRRLEKNVQEEAEKAVSTEKDPPVSEGSTDTAAAPQDKPTPVTCETSWHSSLASGALRLPTSPPATPFDEAAEDELKDSDEEEVQEVPVEQLPWYQQQLYHLYGSHADYYLHPKMAEDEPKVAPRKRGRKIPHETGHRGAGHLWSSLRNDSQMRLLKEDSTIAPELKDAYSAFVRQCLSRQKKPVKRNYYSEEDVPEMERLLDRTRLREAQQLRYKVELMFRSSTINEDRSQVMLYNDPIPNVNNREGEEGVARYMPSWMNEQWDDESIMSYEKWLSARGEGASRASLPDQEKQSADPEQSQWEFLDRRRRPRQSGRQKGVPRVTFLTEEQARCPGQFTQRYKDQRDRQNLPQARDQQDDRTKAASALPACAHTPPTIDGASLRSQSAVPPQRDDPSCQPLSLCALQEYSSMHATQGQGQFLQGRKPVWPAH